MNLKDAAEKASESAKQDFGDRFLRHSARFPKPGSRGPCGVECVKLAFAGSNFSFTGLAAHQAQHLRDRFRGLVVTGAAGPITVEVERADPTWFHLEPPMSTVFSLDLDHSEREVRVAGFPFLGLVETAPTLQARLWLVPDETYFFPAAIENFFRVVAAYRLAKCGGALLHSAGVVYEDQAHLFFGPSGAGKTTLSRLARGSGLRVLSDDLNAFWMDHGRAVVQQVPFAGELGQGPVIRDSFPLRSLSLLHKGPHLNYLPMGRARSLAATFASAPFVNADPFRCESLESNLLANLMTTQIGRLTFSPSHDFRAILRCIETLEEGL